MKNIELKGQSGTAGSDNIPGRIKDLGEHNIALLIREDIQNKLDVPFDVREPVEVTYELSEMSKASVDRFIRRMGDEYFENYFKKSYKNTKYQDAKELMQNGIKLLARKKKWFSLQIIEKNCKGLVGDEKPLDDEKSNFNALMRIINSSEKDSSVQGGTWGKGSSIYTFISGVWFFFAYSVLSQKWKSTTKRFLGRGVFSPFYNNKEDFKYSGQSFYCRVENGTASDALPFVNDDADREADLFELNSRENSEYGTTLFIPGFCPVIEDYSLEGMIQEFRDEILKNWFIPIFHNRLKCQITTSGETITIDRNYLFNVPELKYKLKLLQWRDDGYPESEGFKMEKISIDLPKLSDAYRSEKNQSAWHNKTSVAIDLAVRILNKEEFKDFKDTWKTSDTVALARNNGMIVSYYQGEALTELVNDQVKTESILFAGVLSRTEKNQQAREHMDLFLAYSENPAHNTWCSTKEEISICHLERFDLKNPTNRVRQIKNKILEGLKKIFIKTEPIPPNKDICKMFKLLGGLKTKGDTPISKAKYQANILESYFDDHDRYVVKMKLISKWRDELALSFQSALNTLEGEEKVSFELLQILRIPEFAHLQIFNENFLLIEEGSSPSITILPEETKEIIIRTCSIQNRSEYKNLSPLIKLSEKTTLNEHQYNSNSVLQAQE
ncbi:MAG: hypothetical protein H0W62_09880 [Chitinophagales bacterium]|jgi:hypothetical protein|nr:hypothetical protein [Chitinophagales bacterium]